MGGDEILRLEVGKRDGNTKLHVRPLTAIPPFFFFPAILAIHEFNEVMRATPVSWINKKQCMKVLIL